MPLYDWECDGGHIFEEYVSLSNYAKGMIIGCPKCANVARRVYLTQQQAKNARGFEPTLVYIDANGEICMPAYNDPSQIPDEIKSKLAAEGYKEKYIQTYREYEQFRKDYSSRRNEENQLVDEVRKLDHSALKSEIHNQLNSGFRYIDKEGNDCRVPPLSEMSPKLRQIAEMCLEYVDRDIQKSEEEEYYIQARENDGDYSYRDGQERTRWI